MTRLFSALLLGGSVLVLAACEDANRDGEGRTVDGAGANQAAATRQPAPGALTAEAINTAAYAPPPAEPEATSPTLARAQVLLDRAGFSPGVVDARYGENVRQAIAAFQRARGMEETGELNEQVFQALQQTGGPAAFARYTLTQDDVSGPFNQQIPEKISEQAKLEHLGYTSAAEKIAERFHMDVDLLRTLNPDTDFRTAGATVMVANPARPQIATQVARIEVDRGEKAVKAYDEAGKLLAFYPATIGSSDNPSPSGEMKVNGVARQPTYTYDPAKLDYADDVKTRTTIPPGPNNPVGIVWIDLSKPTYGIHGTPEPDVIGKTASHGCVRLTNWDALHLADAVKPGVRVEFVGEA